MRRAVIDLKDCPTVEHSKARYQCYQACDFVLKGETEVDLLSMESGVLDVLENKELFILMDSLQELSSFFAATGGASVEFDVSSCRKVIERIERSVGVIEGSLNPAIENSNVHKWIKDINQMIKDVKVFFIFGGRLSS